MAQYITSLSLGTALMHLCHSGQQVFSSRHYTTGGSLVGGILFSRGQFCDAGHPRRILNAAELHRRLMPPEVSRWLVWVQGLKELAQAWSLPFRKGRERRWNELLG